MHWVDTKAILFDLDGTLLDSAPDLSLAVDLMLGELGRAPVGEERVRAWVGNGAQRLVKRALTGRMDGEPEQSLFRRAVTRFFALYDEHLTDRTVPYPGVLEALERLASAGYALAVVTNKPERFTLPLLDSVGLSDYFSVVVSGDSLRTKKPDPAPLVYAARRLGCEPGRAVMVGDSLNDIQAGRAAAMRTAWVPYGYNQGMDAAAMGPDLVVHSLLDLVVFLKQAA